MPYLSKYIIGDYSSIIVIYPHIQTLCKHRIYPAHSQWGRNVPVIGTRKNVHSNVPAKKLYKQ